MADSSARRNTNCFRDRSGDYRRVARVSSVGRTEPHIPLADLGQIHARTLVLVGDDDLITLEHSVALYRAIPCAELAVVPGASHMVPLEKPDLVNHLLLDFLRLDAAPTLLPVRRSAAPAPGQEVLT